MFANKQVNVITEQTATVPVTAGPLAEVTKSRTSFENSLNNSGTTSNTLHSQKKNEQLPPVAPKQQAGVAAKQGGGAKGKHQIIKPWSSMNSADLALIAMQLNQDDDEGEVAPTRRRAPPVMGASTTVSYTHPVVTVAQSVPTTPLRATPLASTSHVPAPRTSGNSPVNFFPPAQGFPSQPHGAFTGQPKVSVQLKQMPAPQVTGPATPPTQDIAMPHMSAYHVVAIRQNDPYAFNVLGSNSEQQTASTPPMKPANAQQFTFYPQHHNHHNSSYGSMNASLYSESEEAASTVGYVNSAEVSPVKHQQQQHAHYTQDSRRPSVSLNTMPSAYPAWPQQCESSGRNSPMMQQQSSYSSTYPSVPASPTLPSPSQQAAQVVPAGKKKRVYVNGRPVITTE